MEELTFACMPALGGDERELLLLAASLREFGGRLSGSPLRVLLPNGAPDLSPTTLGELERLGAVLTPFNAPADALDFPYAAKVFAAARAEALAEGQSRLLACLDPDTLFVREPGAFLLPPGIRLGCRPVMLKNVSSVWDEAVDSYWEQIYQACGTPTERLFPLTTTVDGVRIRANINAGLLVVRPQAGLLRRWAECFARLYPDPAFEPLYRQNRLYRIFLHQCVLSASLLAMLERGEMADLGRGYNHPLFLEGRMPAGKRPGPGEAVTLRYDELSYFEPQDWRMRTGSEQYWIQWVDSNLFTNNRPNY